jgi:hypothetical protein
MYPEFYTTCLTVLNCLMTENTSKRETASHYIMRRLQEGEPRAQIVQELLEQGHEMRFITEIMDEALKLHYARRRSKGLVLILVGAMVCFSSFLLTITGAVSGDAHGFALFGLTTIGVVIVFSGFVLIF